MRNLGENGKNGTEKLDKKELKAGEAGYNAHEIGEICPDQRIESILAHTESIESGSLGHALFPLREFDKRV